ncbi:hypothetical protein CHGG_09449 [Chaetomium globosum CBS 148.51]|uniref:Uncharacterized protein n=1 Tax=Chaetomium globosum (strain ATCC 6205 / CBS 148.51 / DSM 1962 / NBRC 6347 / NRRL 1970) TaxID=306901 RepID=Q2GRF5_CHAGB|nr:uncharacterized protein CHGG_09449 [Chaetomium globosum CBS 148.51]EAQ85435.1 hypothetical protein CHGG_09449 [Chaetomium globosum CBS 148.51]
MGHSSKFIFPLPGRRTKVAPPAPATGPLTTKAQKILGTAELSLDSRPSQVWGTQSNSGISIAVTETTNGEGADDTARDEWPGSRALRDRRWEQESEIIPAALGRQSAMLGGSMVPDGATDASSLRRRQSSSTITSYYDKTQLPLSISQQTSNSAMAKGLPPKAMALLDMDGDFTDPTQAKKARKKPSRLDLSALLRGHRSPKHLHPDTLKAHHVGLELSTPSSTLSTAPTPPPVQQRVDRSLRKQTTRESLRESPAQQAPSYDLVGQLGSGKEQTKASMDLYNLYDHYEQRTFADAMDQELHGCTYHLEPPLDRQAPSYPIPPAEPSGKALLSPFPPTGLRPAQAAKPPPLTTAELKLAGIGNPPSPVPADCASVSSRHTRTSKASKRTDRSLQEIDLLQNSVLALSSDSEDDYEPSSKGSLAVPTLSDGQTSPTSPRSPVSQISAYDGNRGKPVRHANLTPSPQTFPSSQGSTAPKGPKISPRSSSLNSKASSGHGLALETSRLSTGTTSTDRTVSNVRTPGSGPGVAPTKALKKVRSESQFDFPAPPTRRGSRSTSVSRVSEQSHPTSPTSVDLYLQSHRSPLAPDDGSIRSGASLSSAANGRRNSAASSIHDSNSGRFMAVTRQEEMLLAALRMKRARMREDIIAEFEDDMDRDEHHDLRREVTNDSIGTSGSMTRQSSRSTIRQEPGALSARPRPPPGEMKATEKPTRGDPLRITIDRSPYDASLRTPASEISDFIHFDGSRSPQSAGGLERKDSRASSISSQRSASVRQRASLTATTAPAPRRSQRSGSTSRRNSGQFSPNGQNDLPHQILEDPAEDDDAGIPRPDSPISPSDFPTPLSIKHNKQVRLSAVGFYKPSTETRW